jgi:hypothetical protein
MPTEDNLDIILESQLEFFGGSGLPKQHFEGSSEGYGLTYMKPVDAPLVSKNSSFVFRGSKIGQIVLDSNTRNLEIVISNSQSETNP